MQVGQDQQPIGREVRMTIQSLASQRKAVAVPQQTRATRSGLPVGVNVKSVGDDEYMFIIVSNGYEDRQGETIKTTALQEYVDKAWGRIDGQCITNNTHLWYHDKTLPKLGDVVWADMQGAFLIEVVKRADNPFARAVYAYVKEHPEREWGSSHGFMYAPEDIDEHGVYRRIHKVETSLLLVEDAANPFTLSKVVDMSQKSDALLNGILGDQGAAEKLRKEVDEVADVVDAMGLKPKSLEVPAVITGDQMPADKPNEPQSHTVMPSETAAVAETATADPTVTETPAAPMDNEDTVPLTRADVRSMIDAAVTKAFEGLMANAKAQNNAASVAGIRANAELATKQDATEETIKEMAGKIDAMLKALSEFQAGTPRNAATDPLTIVSQEHPVVKGAKQRAESNPFTKSFPGLYSNQEED